MNAQFVTRLHKSVLGRIDTLAERQDYPRNTALRLALDLGLYSLAEAVTVKEFLRRLGPLNRNQGLDAPRQLPKDFAKEIIAAAQTSGVPEREMVEAVLEAGCRIIERAGGLAKTEQTVTKPRQVVRDWTDFVRLPEPPMEAEAA